VSESFGLTRRQAQVLRFIGRYFDVRGYAPSYDEINAACTLGGKGHVCEQVAHLRERGYVNFLEHRTRSIKLTDAGEAYVRRFATERQLSAPA
jgi:SOS-response transcriptional repressor LexA